MKSNELLNKKQEISSLISESEFKKLCGRTIKRLRTNKHLTQANLADLCGVTDKHISKIESGNGMPSLYMFMVILYVLDSTFDEFNFLTSCNESRLTSHQSILFNKIIECNPSEKLCKAICTILNETSKN